MNIESLLTVLRDSRYPGQEGMRHQAADTIERMQAALIPLAELPVGAELFIDEESPDTVLYKNGGKAITARDVVTARYALFPYQQRTITEK